MLVVSTFHSNKIAFIEIVLNCLCITLVKTGSLLYLFSNELNCTITEKKWLGSFTSSEDQSMPTWYRPSLCTVDCSRISVARWSEAERGSTCLTAPYDSTSYQDFIWVGNSKSCLASATKQVEIRPDQDGNGPLYTHPKGKRTATGEGFDSVSKYSIGRMVW